MTRLMIVPIEGKGHAILIVTRNAGGAAVMGFVTVSTLGALREGSLSACAAVTLIERHLSSFERVLLLKSIQQAYIEPSIACVEVEAADLIGVDLA